VKESPAAFECKHWKTIELPPMQPDGEPRHWVVFGRVLAIHIDDHFIRDGMVDTGAMQPIGRATWTLRPCLFSVVS
jgi:flavin reductase (DIM6/NTAB) family NADH-FMN oxidoreductase RutF